MIGVGGAEGKSMIFQKKIWSHSYQFLFLHASDQFLSPPVQIARWAHIHRFLSVRLSVRHWIIIHISESNRVRNLTL